MKRQMQCATDCVAQEMLAEMGNWQNLCEETPGSEGAACSQLFVKGKSEESEGQKHCEHEMQMTGHMPVTETVARSQLSAQAFARSVGTGRAGGSLPLQAALGRSVLLPPCCRAPLGDARLMQLFSASRAKPASPPTAKSSI